VTVSRGKNGPKLENFGFDPIEQRNSKKEGKENSHWSEKGGNKEEGEGYSGNCPRL